MRVLQFSTGNSTADRRVDYAKSYADGGDFVAAAELMQQALELAQDWAPGWSLLGDYLKDAGEVPGAIAAWKRLEALDDAGLFGARLKLAAHGAGSAEADPRYVEALFDDYADRFDSALVERLNYRTPGELAALLAPHVPSEPLALAFDVGCGTGLMGAELRAIVTRLVGVDLSEGMIARAARKDLYDELVHGDLIDFLGTRRDADLITASDVLNYISRLVPVLGLMRGAMRTGGLLAFSLESHDGPEEMVLRDSLRFAHRPDLARQGCESAGFDVLAAQSTVLREDRGAPVAGTLIVARAR